MTTMEFNRRYLLNRPVNKWGMLPNRPQLQCRDGFKVSVQASESHYCLPRNNLGPWWAVECGFPSEPVPEWLVYAEDPDAPTETIYRWVPLDTVIAVLGRHGGAVGWRKDK